MMLFPCKLQRSAAILALGISVALPLAIFFAAAGSAGANQEKAADPWSKAQVLQPADLRIELEKVKGESAPTILYVGFRTLFEGGHIPGASFHGTASKEEGLAELKKSVGELPRSTNLVIYCGCCPFDHCPNIRPAYTTLKEMGFSHVRVWSCRQVLLRIGSKRATPCKEDSEPSSSGTGFKLFAEPSNWQSCRGWPAFFP